MLPTTLQMAMLRAPLRLRLAQRGERVRRLARLRDHDGERAIADNRVAVAKLRAVVDLDRQPGQLLDHELADEPRVPADVPHARITSWSTFFSVGGVEAELVERDHAAVRARRRPTSVSLMARGCSKISLSMKCL